MNKSPVLNVIGYMLLAIGFLSLVLDMLGVQLSYLLWMELLGNLTSFLLKLLMIVLGVILLYFGQGNMRLE